MSLYTYSYLENMSSKLACEHKSILANKSNMTVLTCIRDFLTTISTQKPFIDIYLFKKTLRNISSALNEHIFVYSIYVKLCIMDALML